MILIGCEESQAVCLEFMIYFHEKYIIKVQSISFVEVTGFDIITEQLVTVRRNECSKMPSIVLKLLHEKNKEVRYRVAADGRESTKEIAEILGVSTRTLKKLQ